VQHEKNGLKIYPTSDSVAWGLRTVLDHPEHARWMGENGRKLVETEYGWDDIARRTEAIYDPDAGGRFVAPEKDFREVSVADDSDDELNTPGGAAVISRAIPQSNGLGSCVFRTSRSLNGSRPHVPVYREVSA
jgi:hypothetical protein